MRGWALGLVLVAVTSAVGAQDGLRTARAPELREASAMPSEATARIQRAAAAEKFALMFFWAEQNPQTDQAWAVLQAVARRMPEWLDVVVVHMADPAERAVIEHFRADRAPAPLVLAVAPWGTVTQGFTGNFSEAQLQAALVSRGKQQSQKAMQEQKLVLLCVYEQATPGGVAVPAGARDFKADERFGSATEVVLVNARDVKETRFLDELKVDTRAPKPFTVLLVPPGTVVGQFDARTTKDQMWTKLASTLSRAGAGGSCGPSGCRPKQ